MRNAAVILAFLGAVSSAAGTGTWSLKTRQEVVLNESRLRARKIAPPDRARARSALTMLFSLPYFLALGCVMGAVGARLAYGYRGKCACGMLLVAASGPLLLAGPKFAWLSKKPDLFVPVAVTIAALAGAGALAYALPSKAEAQAEGGDG